MGTMEDALTLGGLAPLTIRGRMAYGLCLVEQAVLKQGAGIPQISQLLNDLWAFVSMDLPD